MDFNNILLSHSVALAFSAIRLLQDADIFRMTATSFQEKKDKRESLVCVDLVFMLFFVIWNLVLSVGRFSECWSTVATYITWLLLFWGENNIWCASIAWLPVLYSTYLYNHHFCCMWLGITFFIWIVSCASIENLLLFYKKQDTKWKNR